MAYSNETPEEEIIQRGREAWKRISKGQHFNDWMDVARAIAAGRERLLREMHLEPRADGKHGRAYNEALNDWLRREGWHGIDSNTMTQLSWCLKHLGLIEEERTRLLRDGQQRKYVGLNHPKIVRKWIE